MSVVDNRGGEAEDGISCEWVRNGMMKEDRKEGDVHHSSFCLKE